MFTQPQIPDVQNELPGIPPCPLCGGSTGIYSRYIPSPACIHYSPSVANIPLSLPRHVHYIHHHCISPGDRRQTCVSGAIHSSISMRGNCFLPRLQWEHVGKDDTATHLMDFISSTFLPTEWPFLGSISQFSSVNCPVTVFLVSWSRSEVRCNFFSHISHIWFSS